MAKNQDIGKKLRILIAEKDLSKKVVAEYVGVDPTTLSNHLKGKYAPNLEVLTKYAELLGVNVAYFLTTENGEQFKVAENPNPYGLEKHQIELLEMIEAADDKTQDMIWKVIDTILATRKQNK